MNEMIDRLFDSTQQLSLNHFNIFFSLSNVKKRDVERTRKLEIGDE